MLKHLTTLSFFCVILSFYGCNGSSESSSENETIPPSQSELRSLGERLFHDKNLSFKRTQSCASCHNPEKGFVDTRENHATRIGVSLGDDGVSIGTRNAPTLTYAKFSHEFIHQPEKNSDSPYSGGQFLDGRATNLADQAGHPPLNPVEMAMESKAAVVDRLKEDTFYKTAFERYFGQNILDNAEKAYIHMTQAIAAFEQSELFAPFDSKWDKYLKGEYTLSFSEQTGKSVFFSAQNSSCVNCHMIHNDTTIFGQLNPQQTFTNYGYFNIGTPKNKALIDAITLSGLHPSFILNGDQGLFENPQVNDVNQKGKFKTPTLRNVAITSPYMHNGVFKDLRTVLSFYDFRGSSNESRRAINLETNQPWNETDNPENIDHQLLGQQAMSDAEIQGLECFLRLLTDSRFEPLMPTHRLDGSEIRCD